jgi:OmcA/MtrC family decaheme c-type cytochrome
LKTNEVFMKKLAGILAILGIIALGTGIHLLLASSASEGIVSEITNVTIGEDKVPVVTFTLADSNGNPLTTEDVQISFLIARIEKDRKTRLTQYVNYFTHEVQGAEYQYHGQTMQPALASVTQPTFEPGQGQFAEVSPGVYTYTFGEPLGEGYDPTLTHVVGAEVIRGARTVAANPTYTFVPAGGEPRTTRLISSTETCNGCHQKLEAHGGSRQRFELCVLCHTPQNIDPETGNTLDAKVFFHRLHSGELLPSVVAGKPYYVVGFRQTVVDFSMAAWSQDTRNCETCHTGTDGDHYKTAPNNAACTSCHDNVDVSIAQNHPGRPKTDDRCAGCHTRDYAEFDEGSIAGSHVIPRYSTRIKGVNLEIVSVTGVSPGGSPTITFKVTDNAGNSIAPADMDYLAVTLAGPTTDYTARTTETIFRKPSDQPPNVQDMGDGVFSYTLQFVIPSDATGTYALGMEGYVMETIPRVDDPVRVAGFNPVVYASLDGSNPVPRRQVVDRDLCNACHKDLAAHGTIRQNPEYCVLCHNPNATDEERRPAEAMPPTSINFRVLIHRIHRGEEAKQPLQVYGFGNSLVDFSGVRFPGILSNCQTCHLEGTYNLPTDLQPTIITEGGEVISQTGAGQSVCTTCHDSPAAIGHAQIQTTVGGVETCEVCHGPGREFNVVDIHDP